MTSPTPYSPKAANLYGIAVGTASTGNLLTFVSTVSPGSTNVSGPNGPFSLGQRWLNTTNSTVYTLVGLTATGGAITATWVIDAGGTGVLNTLTGDSGGAISPTAGNINLTGGTTGLTLAGSGSTLTLGGTLAVSNGGTGVSTLTGLALGVGTAGFMAVPYTTVTAWTPNLQINGSSTGITYVSTSGFYQVVGAVVNFNASINLSSKGASVGAVTISNLPVATGTNGALNSIYVITGSVTASGGGYTDVYAGFNASSTVLNFGQIGSGAAPLSLSNTNVANNSSFLITGSYFTN